MKQRNTLKVTATLCVLLVTRMTGGTAAEDSRCDPQLLRMAGKGPLSYQNRGDRCEGLYGRASSSMPQLTLVSLTRSFPNIDPRTVPKLILRWASPAKEEVRLQAKGLRYKLYYEMDAVRPAGERQFSWSTDFLKNKEIDVGRTEIGVTCRTVYPIGGKKRELYLPLTVGSDGNDPPPQSTVEVLIVPSVELKDAYYSVTAFSVPGNGRKSLVHNKSIQLPAYPADRPFPIRIALASRGSLYFVEIVGLISTGGSVETGFWFAEAQ
jgi:hypothetical protein